VSDRHEDRPVSTDGSTVGWPGGWYVYENGRVQGPFAAEVAFNVTSPPLAGTPQRLVSRKGFSQWYPLGEIAELYRIADKLGHKASAEVDKLESQIAENLANLEVLRALVQTGADPSVIARTPAPSTIAPRVVARTIDSRAQPVPAPNYAPSPTSNHASHLAPHQAPTMAVSQQVASASHAEVTLTTQRPRKLSRREKKALARQQQKETTAQQATRTSAEPTRAIDSITTSQAPASINAQHLLTQEYTTLRGRLRLGEARNPFVSGGLWFPLSLGLYWGVWFTDLTREVSWHANNTSDHPHMPPAWLAWVPGLHVFATFKLAQAIQAMESQNGYRNVSPMLAALFSLIPPFAMIYLQDCVNQHWWLHVRSAVMNRRK
jgi:hypothetical protein